MPSCVALSNGQGLRGELKFGSVVLDSRKAVWLSIYYEEFFDHIFPVAVKRGGPEMFLYFSFGGGCEGDPGAHGLHGNGIMIDHPRFDEPVDDLPMLRDRHHEFLVHLELDADMESLHKRYLFI